MQLRKQWAVDPEQYAVERLGMRPTWQQKKIFQAIAPEGAKVSVRSGHGIGKSGATSGSILWFLETREYSKIPCTAPTSAQLRDVLWAELNKWIRKGDALSQRRGDNSRFWLSNLFTVNKDRVQDIGAPGEWYAVARTSGRDNPDALQGFHASNVEISEDGMSVADDGGGEGKILFVCDEASGIYEAVFEVAEGALSSHGARLLMLGNPTRTSGYFYRSHHADRGDFTALHFKSSESPLVDKNYRARLVRKYGEGSNVVRVRADGEFPKQEDDVLIGLDLTEPCIEREPVDHGHLPIKVGADIARFGNDRVTIWVRQGANLLHGEVHAKNDTMTTTGLIVKVANLFGADDIYIDGIGLGAGVVDRLREVRKAGRVKGRIHDVVVARSAPPRSNPYDTDVSTVDAQGAKLRDYLWLEAQKWFRDDAPSFKMLAKDMAEDLAGEYTSVKYKHDSSGRLVVESKEEMKKRLGFSPDLADGVNLTFAPDDPSDSDGTVIIELTREPGWGGDYE